MRDFFYRVLHADVGTSVRFVPFFLGLLLMPLTVEVFRSAASHDLASAAFDKGYWSGIIVGEFSVWAVGVAVGVAVPFRRLVRRDGAE